MSRLRSDMRHLELVFLAAYTDAEFGSKRVRAGLRAVLRVYDRKAEHYRRPAGHGLAGHTTLPLLNAVSTAYRVAVADLVGPSRGSRSVALVRAYAMWVVREFTTLSLPDIGAAFGGRDHTTVIYAVRRVAGLCECDRMLEARLRRVGRASKVRAPLSARVAA